MVTRRQVTALFGSLAGAAGVAPLTLAAPWPVTSTAKRTYVLVHGAGGGGWCWRLMAPYLVAAGHTVYPLTLTGAGERWHLVTPDTDLSTHVADVTATMKWEDLNEVILVGHSYGGMVITGAADRALERISQMVYLDAAHPVSGEALADVAPAVVSFGLKTRRVIDGVEVMGAPGFENRERNTERDQLAPLGDTPEALQEWMASHGTPVPVKAITEKLHLAREDAIRRLPRTNINTTSSNAMPHTADALHRQNDADRVWTVDTTHNLMITKPKETADLLLRLAAL